MSGAAPGQAAPADERTEARMAMMRLALLSPAPDTALDITARLRNGGHIVHAYDSAAQLLRELGRESFDLLLIDESACDGGLQRFMKRLFALAGEDTALIFINQLREKIGVFFGSPETTTGGKALKFYASVRLDIRRIETLKDGQESVGNRTRVKVVKNKMAPPFKQAEFDIIYGTGISREGSLIDMGVDIGIVKKSGAWYTYEADQLGQGKENARAFLLDNPDLANEIENKIREHFVPVEVDPALVAAIDEAAAEVDF